MKPTFFYEKKFWQKGYKYVVGIDEVGRGSFAGPVVAGAVIFAPTPQIKNSKLKMKNWEEKISDLGITDSKLLKPRQREQLVEQIKKHSLAWDITEVGVSVINRLGIGKATQKAMRETIGDLTQKGFKPDFVLADYFYISYLRGLGRRNQLGIKKGDQKSISIAAASILAKVYRDKIMESLSKQSKYKKYGWGRNKGYGTREHQKAILRYGLTRYHRKQFVRGLV